MFLPFILLTFIFTALVSPAFAGSAGKSGFNFLKLAPDARSAAVGEAVVTNYGANSIFYNPAGLARVKKTELSFHHLAHFGDMPYESIAFGTPASFGGWSLGLSYFNVNDIPRTVFSSATPDRFVETGTTKASDLAVALGFGSNITSKLALGAGIKTVSEKLDNKSATAVMLDLGLIYVFYTRYDNAAPIKAAVSFRNIGPDAKFSDVGVSLPMEARLGLSSHTRHASNLWSRWSLELSRFFERGENTTLGKAGMEFTCAGLVNFGVGYRYQFRRLHLGKLAGFSFGVGLETAILNFNYALSPYGEMGDSHYFTLRWPLPLTGTER